MKLNASIVTMNPLRILDEVRLAEGLGVQSLHFDFMDGHRVPRYGLYPEILAALAEETDLIFDVHLMVDDLPFAMSQIIPHSRIDTVSFHFTDNLEKVLYNIDFVRKLGCRPLLCIDLSTPLSFIDRICRFEEIDGLNFLAIHPGVVRQEKRIAAMIEVVPDFVQTVVSQSSRPRSDFEFQCDGGVTFESIPDLREVGINNFVLGTGALYKNRKNMSPDLDQLVVTENMDKIIDLIKDQNV